MTVAWILRPRGVRGELVAQSAQPDPARFFRLPRLFLQPANRPVEIERARPHQGRWLLKFRHIDTPEQAETLRGAELAIPLADRPPPPPGQIYYDDLIGCRIVDRSGADLGEVTGYEEPGGQVLLEVRHCGRDVLIPLVPAICQVQLDARRILVDLPEGLLEL